MSVIFAILLFSMLIFVHELGHFAAAKLSGEGLRGYPNHTDFSPDDPRITEMNGCRVAVMEETYAL